ncbi:MAG TPA: hypothetical protein VKV80_18615 [Streptosporangiaceae bacterium]|nr:hypothetical protein [Streptosporangiaceae bacterium]
MDLTPYTVNLRRELAVAAEAGGEEARALAGRLTAPLESAIRLTLLDALSAAADEITRELAPGSVEVRLRGGEPDFVVTPPPAEDVTEDAGDTSFKASLIRMGEVMMGVRPSAASAPADADETTTARINFRPPEHLKARIEEAASREGLSVNAWLVRAVTAALEVGGGGADARPAARRAPRGGQRYTGWVR